MVWVSGQNLPVSVCVLMCVFTFELQLESSANMFHTHGYFYTVDLGVYETANL